jgi:hypothetical protein
MHKLYIDIMLTIQGIQNNNMRKTLLLYEEEMEKMLENVYATTKKRNTLKLPPVILPVRFVMPNGDKRGDNGAPIVIDLRGGEQGKLRIPSYDVVVQLKRGLVRALVEENNLNPRPSFVLQVTRRGLLRLIASRYTPPTPLALPLWVVTIDENSRHGHSLAHWYINETKTSLTHFEKLRPKNHGFRRETAALLQSFADKPNEETKKQLAEILPLEVLKTLTTERARESARLARKREKRLNDSFVSDLIAKVRSVVREARRRG